MDQGIIQNLRSTIVVLSSVPAAIDSNTEFEFNLLDALNVLSRAWNEVKLETLRNCFQNAGFYA